MDYSGSAENYDNRQILMTFHHPQDESHGHECHHSTGKNITESLTKVVDSNKSKLLSWKSVSLKSQTIFHFPVLQW